MSGIEETTAADPVIRGLQRGIRALPLGRIRGLLRGGPLGHPAHPLLVEVPMGCWMSAALLDAVPGAHRAATVLTAAGLVGVAPAAAAGWADWAELPPRQARVGVAHAAANAAAVACYAISLADRLRGAVRARASVVVGGTGRRRGERGPGRTHRLQRPAGGGRQHSGAGAGSRPRTPLRVNSLRPRKKTPGRRVSAERACVRAWGVRGAA
ncbi:hypothetical protein GCM10020254_08070 [Streptomyces goshikiensis]